MPHYFFDLVNGIGYVTDEEGRELPDLSAAREQAIREARSIMAEDVRSGQLDLTGRIMVRCGADQTLFESRFDEALEIKHPEDRASEGQE